MVSDLLLRFPSCFSYPRFVGATVLTVAQAGNLAVADMDIATMLLGLATTVIVGYFSLKLLHRIVLEGRFQLFAFYCWAIGLIVVLTQALGTL